MNFKKIIAAHQKFFLESSQKTPVQSLVLVKLQAFTEAATGVLCKERYSQNS